MIPTTDPVPYIAASYLIAFMLIVGYGAFLVFQRARYAKMRVAVQRYQEGRRR